MTANQIIATVADVYGVSYADIRKGGRHRPLIDARHVAVWFIRKKLGMSFPQIGKAMGGRHHTSIFHSVKRVEAELSRADVREMVERIGKLIPVSYTPFDYKPGRLHVPHVEEPAA